MSHSERAWHGVHFEAVKTIANTSDVIHPSITFFRHDDSTRVIGRNQDDQKINHGFVSRFHLLVQLPSAEDLVTGLFGYVLVLGQNGTCCNGRRMAQGSRFPMYKNTFIELVMGTGICYRVHYVPKLKSSTVLPS
jgi:hypothetical protein